MTQAGRIFVTGAAGFIGSTLVERLLTEGREVVGLDSFDSFYARGEKESNLAVARRSSCFRFVEGDIRNAQLVEQIFREGQFDAIVHLAALAGVRPSLERPSEYADVNVNGTTVLLSAAVQNEISHFVLGSSSSVYGERSDGPFKETDPVERPVSPYAATKRACELIAHTFHHTKQLSVTALRFFTVFGPRQRPDLAIRKFAEKMLLDQSLPVFGDGSALRDFTFVDDIVEGIVRSIDRPLGYEILNLGAGRTVSVLDVIRALETALQRKAKIDWLPLQPGEVSKTWANTEAAISRLGYAPSTSLEDGIAAFVEWLRKQR